MKSGTRLLASLSLCAVATMLAGALATLKVTAAGSADIDQCGNGPVDAPVPCTGLAWQNGNANANGAHWAEGDSIAYRIKFTALTAGSSHQVTIEWDTTKAGKHALDYLTSYNRTEKTGNNPCSDVPGCDLATATTFAIPPDLNTGLNLPPATSSPANGRWDQVLTMFGGTITSVTTVDPSIPNATVPYNLTGTYGGDSSTSITITFTATTANPVLAWGGHIATRKDWGMSNSAVAITGSPFHMRVLGLDGVGGNQDRGLSSSAVVYPAILTITKNVLASDGTALIGPTPFNFTSTSPSINSVPEVDPTFTLVNDGVAPPPDTLPANQRQFRLYTFGSTAPVTVTETATPGFGLNNLTCTATLNGGAQADTITESLATATTTIVASEGQEINCTFTNQQYATLTVIKSVVKTNGGTADASAFTVRVTGPNSTNVAAPGSAAGTIYSFAPGTYTVSEDAPLLSGYQRTGFSGDCDATGKVVLTLGGSKTCTITNHDVAGHLIVRKVVDNTYAGTKRATNFSFSVNGGAATAFVQDGTDVLKGKNTVDVPAGSFSVVESATPIAGYTTTYAGCSGTILNDETKTCTITNTAQSGTLIVQAIVINDNGGTKQATQLTFQIGTNAPITFLQDGANVLAGKNTFTEPVGTYTITAPAVTGYTITYSNCANVVIASQDTQTCTITFDDTPAHLIINKLVVNNNGGSLTAAAFSGTIGGTVVAAGGNTWSGASTDRTLTAIGSYSVAENAHPGYDATFSAGCTGTIALGEIKTCTVTNDDQPSHLIVKKVVVNNNGGALTAAAFSGTIGGDVVATGGNTWVGALTDRTLTAVGNYSVAESAHPGYDATFSTDCTGTIALGETKTCTITNDDQPPHLIINKVVVNDNGGSATPANFSGTVTGVTAAGGTAWTGASTNLTLTSVGTYNVTEGAHPGYDATFSTDCTGTIALGETKTCTVTNNDQPAHLIIKKVVVNDDGGSLTAAGFSGTIGGAVIATGGNTWTGASTDRVLTAIGNYSIAENAHPGYDATFSTDCTGTIALGETKTCTVTNNDQPAHLIINKVVVNNDGGSLTAAAFSGTIGGQVVAAGGNTWTGASTSLTLTAVGSYTVAENAHPGYTATFSTDCSGTIALGETRTCTITNDDQAAHLIINKTVVNDNGGSATAAAFSGSVSGVTAAGGATWTGASTALTLTSVGSYTVSENPYVGYDAAFSTDCTGTIALGETRTCTVTNNDRPAHLIINKVVVNNNGGALAAAGFSGTIGGAVVAAGGNTWSGASTDRTLTAIGSYTVAENAHPGYDATFATECSGTIALGETKTCTVTNDDQAAHVIVNVVVTNNNGGSLTPADFSGLLGSVVATGGNTWTGATTSFTLTTVGAYAVTDNAHPGYDVTFSSGCTGTIALGETKTCTVTYNDLAAHLIINKVVVNDDGGSLTAAGFSGTIGGAVIASGGNTWLGATTNRTLTAIGSYTVAENAHPGYDATFSADCSGTIGLGETKTCTVTNNDQPAHLIINKVVINNNGGALTAGSFSGTITGQVLAAGGNTWTGASTSLTLTAVGSYTVAENAHPGYAAAFSTDCSGTIALGETRTCTVTNDDMPATLTLIKHVDNSNGGSAKAGDFTLTASGTAIPGGWWAVPGAEAGVTIQVNAGTYVVTESGVAGYKQLSAVGCQGAIVNGGTATCTITNGDSKARPTGATAMSWVLHDTLIVNGIRPGASGATVTFKLYGPDDPTCSGTVLNGNGSGEVRPVTNGRASTLTGYNLLQSQLPNKKGTFRWVAQYSGDNNNNAASTTCGDETHSITVLDSPLYALFIAPVNGAANVDTSLPIQWTPVGDAQAYYLYIGTSRGAKNLVDSGELHTTSYYAYGLPANQLLYARLWTWKTSVWRYTDITFTTGSAGLPLAATVITPANGETNVDPNGLIQWTSLPNAEKYYVFVGSTPGTNDLIDSQEICNGCVNSPMAPFWSLSNAGKAPAQGLANKRGQTVYLRLWTMVGGIWRSVDTSFTVAP